MFKPKINTDYVKPERNSYTTIVGNQSPNTSTRLLSLYSEEYKRKSDSPDFGGRRDAL
jgi:hypothetical protein